MQILLLLCLLFCITTSRAEPVAPPKIAVQIFIQCSCARADEVEREIAIPFESKLANLKDVVLLRTMSSDSGSFTAEIEFANEPSTDQLEMIEAVSNKTWSSLGVSATKPKITVVPASPKSW